MSNDAQPVHLHIYVKQPFIPTQTFVDEEGKPYSRFTMMEDFEVEFRASLLMSDHSYREVTRDVTWSVGTFLNDPNRPPGTVHPGQRANVLRGVQRGFIELSAFFPGMELSAWAEVEILESDLLVYAPDGNVYRIPGELWLGKAKGPRGKRVECIPWTEEGRKRLPDAVWDMLANELVVANVPNPVQKAFPDTSRRSSKRKDTAARESATSDPVETDNVTCFLLNLNSVALSYSPRPTPPPTPPSQQPAKPGRSKPGSQAKTPATRRKRR